MANEKSKGTRKITILLADDHPLTRAGIAEFLKREPSFDLIAEAEDGAVAWAA